MNSGLPTGLLLAAVLITLELVRRLPVLASFRRLGHGGRRAGRLLRARCSDATKERASGLLARRLFGASCRAGGLLLLAASPVLLLVMADHLMHWGVAQALGELQQLCAFYKLLGTYPIAA